MRTDEYILSALGVTIETTDELPTEALLRVTDKYLLIRSGLSEKRRARYVRAAVRRLVAGHSSGRSTPGSGSVASARATRSVSETPSVAQSA